LAIAPNTPIAAFVKRLRCRMCGSQSVLATRIRFVTIPIKHGGIFASLTSCGQASHAKRSSPGHPARQMQRVLACINANCAGDYKQRASSATWGMLLVLLSPHPKPLGARARPVHPILRHRNRAQNTSASCVPDGKTACSRRGMVPRQPSQGGSGCQPSSDGGN
jgi:hypothetical protein